jgi:hypothetical protein
MNNSKFRFYAIIIALLFFSVVVFSSCEDQTIEPGIIYTDTPPENLFSGNSNYAVTNKVWVDYSSIALVKEKGYGCNYWIDENTGEQISSDCGKWKIIQCPKYWGMLNGIHYISNSMDWYVVTQQTFTEIEDLIKKRGVMISYMYLGGRTPWGNLPLINGYNE